MTEHADSSWRGTGLSPLTGHILEILVSQPESSAAEIAATAGTSTAAAARALRALEADVLAVQVSKRPVRWSAGPPRPALGSLLTRRREELVRLEAFAELLHGTYTSAAHHRFATDQFEILDTEEQVTARYTHLLRASDREILHLTMPPYVASLDSVQDRLATQAEAIRSGVRFRSVYDIDTLTDEVSLDTARRSIAMGGEVRLSSELPMKLVLFDSTTAIMPLRQDDPAAGSLVVHWPTLLHVLRALFESLWTHGVPLAEPRTDVGLPESPVAENAGDGPDDRTREILRLMSLGMKDDAIARVLRISRRTIQKHVSDLGQRLGARTRFQIALLAREGGWLDPSGNRAPAEDAADRCAPTSATMPPT